MLGHRRGGPEPQPAAAAPRRRVLLRHSEPNGLITHDCTPASQPVTWGHETPVRRAGKVFAAATGMPSAACMRNSHGPARMAQTRPGCSRL